MDLLGDESEHWCGVSVRVLVSATSVLVLISLVYSVCETDLPSVSVSGCDIVEPQTLSFSGKRGASVTLELRTVQENESKHEGSTLPVGTQEKASEGGA